MKIADFSNEDREKINRIFDRVMRGRSISQVTAICTLLGNAGINDWTRDDVKSYMEALRPI